MDRDEQAKMEMQKIAKMIQKELPEGMGFCLLAFDFGNDPLRRLNYVSNGNRQDIVKVMREWITKTATTFGEHVVEPMNWKNLEELKQMELDVNQKIWCLNKSDFSDFSISLGGITELEKKNFDWSNYLFTKFD